MLSQTGHENYLLLAAFHKSISIILRRKGFQLKLLDCTVSCKVSRHECSQDTQEIAISHEKIYYCLFIFG